VVPFFIGSTTTPAFEKVFMLVDEEEGICPAYSRFVHGGGGFKEPVPNEESTFSSWLEGARKDVERALLLWCIAAVYMEVCCNTHPHT
jgi:hypothetical protein